MAAGKLAPQVLQIMESLPISQCVQERHLHVSSSIFAFAVVIMEISSKRCGVDQASRHWNFLLQVTQATHYMHSPLLRGAINCPAFDLISSFGGLRT